MTEQNPIRRVRKICELTQAELADILDCARLTIHTLESKKLKLSERMAEKLALHTGVSKAWLQDPKRKFSPMCERDPQRPYTLEVFKTTRADVCDPRVDPLNVRAIDQFVTVAYRRLLDAAGQAYDTNKIVHFNYALREFLEQLDVRWPDSGKIRQSMEFTEIRADALAVFEKSRRDKVSLQSAKLSNKTSTGSAGSNGHRSGR